MSQVGEAPDSVKLSEEDLERLAQRVAELLFHKIMRRVAKAAAVGETIPPPRTESQRSKPDAAAFEAVRARRARRGVY
jgi:hypothetical protein